jgi:small-conductance mechanosensitive channel
LRNDSTTLTINDFINAFGSQEGSELFLLFDQDFDNSVNSKEFINIYFGLFREKLILKASLDNKDKSIKKLNIVISMVFIPFTLFIALSFLGHNQTFSNIFGKMLSIFIPLSFIFKSVIEEIFQSIIFIFTVRPFDIGDLITVDGKDYEVREMGLLYTTLISDSRFFHFSNEYLRKKPIVNLRKSKYVTEIYEQHFHNKSCLEKIPLIRLKIKEFLKENSKMYDKTFSISNYRFDAKNTIRITISIQLHCSYQNIKAINQRKDNFSIFLYNTVKELNIESI